MPEVPEDRAHERVVLRQEVLVREGADEEDRSFPGVREEVDDLVSFEDTTDVKVHGGRTQGDVIAEKPWQGNQGMDHDPRVRPVGRGDSGEGPTR